MSGASHPRLTHEFITNRTAGSDPLEAGVKPRIFLEPLHLVCEGGTYLYRCIHQTAYQRVAKLCLFLNSFLFRQTFVFGFAFRRTEVRTTICTEKRGAYHGRFGYREFHCRLNGAHMTSNMET